MYDKSAILKAKEEYCESEFIGGVIACDFLLMKEMGLDIIYHNKNEVVQQYKNLLRERLETDSFSLMLMVSTEIEKCCMDEREKVYKYLCDEIYEHFKNNGKKYPLQAVGLHIDIITTFVCLNEKKGVIKYLHTIKEIYKEIFGEKSYLFCRNWSYILNEIFLKLIPEVAIEEFMDNINLFSRILKEDKILYLLCINIAVEKAKQEQKINCLKDSINLCEKWCKDISVEKQKEINALVRGTAGMYCRNIGEYDEAIKIFGEVIEFAEDIRCRLAFLAQIASILYIKHDFEQLNDFLAENVGVLETLQDLDENAAELYSIYACYYMQIRDYQKAKIQIEKAIDIGEQILGKNADTAIKFRCNKYLIEYNSGEYDKDNTKMLKILDIVSRNPQQYPISLPLVLNNLVAMSFEEEINSTTVLRMEKVLRSNEYKYDIATNIIFKCNLYCIMMASGDTYDEVFLESLRKELENYFRKYPYSEGYFVYLKGEYCRQYQKKDVSLNYKFLDKIEEGLDRMNLSTLSREYVTFFVVRLKNLLYKKDYSVAKRWLMNLWSVVVLPLFKTMLNRNEEDVKSTCLLLRTYMSLYISSVQQYPQLKITDKELYEFVLNFKYFEDLFYYNSNKFALAVESERWIPIESITLSRDKLILECFCYTKYNMEDMKVIFGVPNKNVLSSIYQICFALELTSSVLSKCSVTVVSDILFKQLSEKMIDIFEMEEVSQIEKMIWNKIQKFVNKKEKIYVCTDILTIQIPLAAMKVNDQQYLGELCQIIYCNTGLDVKDDIEIQDFSSSIYFGMSIFDDKKRDGQMIRKKFCDLPYIELEVELLGDLMGGEVCLNQKVSKAWFNGQKREIMHVATHTMEDKDGEKALVIGKESSEKYLILKSTDIAKLNWRGVSLVVLSACETGEEPYKNWGRHSLSQAVRKAGALFCISTVVEVPDGVNSFFMVSFYKKLLSYRKIGKAFWEAQKTMRTITKKEILLDDDYLDIGMDYYLQNYEQDSRPFELVDDWASYMLQMN